MSAMDFKANILSASTFHPGQTKENKERIRHIHLTLLEMSDEKKIFTSSVRFNAL